MRIRFKRGICLCVCNHNADQGDTSFCRYFHEGGVYQVGEVSPVREESVTVMEFFGLGFAEVPDDCWVYEECILLHFRHPELGSSN